MRRPVGALTNHDVMCPKDGPEFSDSWPDRMKSEGAR